ncbi:MAG TPA: hypothetical protein VIX86_22000 [Streptosporangiaceae bacterium]
MRPLLFHHGWRCEGHHQRRWWQSKRRHQARMGTCPALDPWTAKLDAALATAGTHMARGLSLTSALTLAAAEHSEDLCPPPATPP